MSYLIIGLEGLTLTRQEQAWLAREEVGGVIVFTRNFQDPGQFGALLDSVRAVDPEGQPLSRSVTNEETTMYVRITSPGRLKNSQISVGIAR